MARSKWKYPFIDKGVLKVVKDLKGKNKPKNNMRIWSRRSVILPIFVGHTFDVYNGQKFISLLVRDYMVGYKFGDFIFTRRMNLNSKLFAAKKKKK